MGPIGCSSQIPTLNRKKSRQRETGRLGQQSARGGRSVSETDERAEGNGNDPTEISGQN